MWKRRWIRHKVRRMLIVSGVLCEGVVVGDDLRFWVEESDGDRRGVSSVV